MNVVMKFETVLWLSSITNYHLPVIANEKIVFYSPHI
jgi:hypothetical protein